MQLDDRDLAFQRQHLETPVAVDPGRDLAANRRQRLLQAFFGLPAGDGDARLHDPVRGQHLEARVVDVCEEGEGEARGRVRRPARLFGVGQGGLVTVMAVGDEQLQRGQRSCDGACPRAVRHGPQPLRQAVVVVEGDVRRALGCLVEQPLQLGPGVVDEPQRLQARARRAHQRESILFGTAVRALVRQDDSSLVRLQAQRRQQVAPGAAVGKVHVVHVHRGVVGAQRSALQPGVESPRRAVVILAWADEADDVVR